MSAARTAEEVRKIEALTERLVAADILPPSKLRLYAEAVVLRGDRREALLRGTYGEHWREDKGWMVENCEASVVDTLARLDEKTRRIYAANAAIRPAASQERVA